MGIVYVTRPGAFRSKNDPVPTNKQVTVMRIAGIVLIVLGVTLLLINLFGKPKA